MKSIRFLSIAFLLLCMNSVGYGQVDADSEPTRSRVMWDKVMEAMMQRDMKLSEARMDTMIVWASADNDQEQLGYALQAKAQMHTYRGEYDVALPLTKKWVSIFQELNERKDMVLLSNSTLSIIHKRLGNMDSTFYYLYKGKSMLSSVPDSIHFRTHTTIYNDLGVTHFESGNLDSAAYYHIRQLDYVRPNDTIHLYGTYFNIVKVMGALKNYSEAERYLDLVIPLTSGSSSKDNHARAYNVKAQLLLDQKEYDKAEVAARRAIALHEENGFARNAVNRYTTFARILIANNKLDKARIAMANIEKPETERNLQYKSEYYITALELALKAKNYPEYKQLLGMTEETVLALGQVPSLIRLKKINAEYYNSTGQVDKAYSELKTYNEEREKFLDEENIKVVNHLQAQYETEQKEKLIIEQDLEINKTQSRSRLLGGIAVVILLLGGLIFWFMRQQSKIQTALQSSEILSLKKENKLIAMQSILSGQEEERKRIAQDLHDNIGTLMLSIKMKVLDIQKSIEGVQRIDVVGEVDSMIGQAANEIRRISHNMTPVAMDMTGLEGAVEDLGTQLNQNGISASFQLSGLSEIKDKHKQVVLYRVVQELVNNIGKHSNARSASIISVAKDDYLTMTITDDGVGISVESWTNGNGMGIKSIKSRIDYLEGEISMNNSNGTIFTIKVPTL